MKPVYLDCNASTPIAMEVKGFMARALDGGLGKPWSAH
jgi:cysteine sulfinate desulfinase/cysteine desulfurase-like protein